MFTQAFLCYINRHAELAGEGEKKREREETDRWEKKGDWKKKITDPFIPPHPLSSTLTAPVFRLHTEWGNKEHLSQCTFVRSMQRS